ncbi:MAG TPA: proton-conducting transporter membrane subunit [Terriglobales bacterium]|jgi:NADH-quinone oxidoreductase subunit M
MERGVMLTAVAIGVPWAAALGTVAANRRPRAIGFTAAFIAVTASALLLRGAPAGDSLTIALMVLYSCLTLGATLMLPRRDCTSGMIAGILFLLGSTLLAYSTDDLRVLLAAWIVSSAPFLREEWFGAPTWRPKLGLLLSGAALALAVAVIAASGGTMSIGGLIHSSPTSMTVFGLLVAAVVFRKGICPAHAWVADAAQGGAAIPTALLLNGHFGAMLAARLILPLFPDTARELFPLLSYLALGTALYVAVRALTENSPRRLIAYLALSQSACILAGLESQTIEGVTGALVHWFVVSASTMGLFGIVRLLEVRFGENLTGSTHLGLAEHAPRLACFFIVFGLALVGLPGTLGFCSLDLLVHGTMASHPLTGLLLPIATAMNAVSVFRLFARLFLGRRKTGLIGMADALPRERWIFTVGVAFFVLGGLFPSAIVARRAAEAEMVEQALQPPKGSSDTVAERALRYHHIAIAQVE